MFLVTSFKVIWYIVHQAVCVTTHKGSWVKLFMCLISIVTRSSSHLVREMNQNPGSKTLLPFLKNITEESDLENFQDLILALDACYWLHKVISISLSRFERRSKPVRFLAVISCFSEDFMYCLVLCLYVYFYLRRV